MITLLDIVNNNSEIELLSEINKLNDSCPSVSIFSIPFEKKYLYERNYNSIDDGQNECTTEIINFIFKYEKYEVHLILQLETDDWNCGYCGKNLYTRILSINGYDDNLIELLKQLTI